MNELNLMYLFTNDVYAKTKQDAHNLQIPLRDRCLDFAKSHEMLVSCDQFGFFDESLSMRIIFNVKGSQDSVLLKVSALFSFAALNKLVFVNQEFLSK